MNKIKKISIIALAAIMTIGMMAGMFSFYQVNAAEPADEATITVQKTLTINGKKFPDVKHFVFKLEAIEGYHNENGTANNNSNGTINDGTKIPTTQVPMPEGATAGSITTTPVTNRTCNINVGNFDDTDTNSGDTATSKKRIASFPKIKYTKAGYYLYKLRELGSKQNTDADIKTDVPGVFYDKSMYWVVVYVVNNIDKTTGDTTDGVHVESITAWHNEASLGNENHDNDYVPNLKDIAAWGVSNDDTDGAENKGDNKGNTLNKDTNSTYGGGQKTTDTPNSNQPDSGTNPADNHLQRWDDLGKVGLSTPPNPDDPNNEEGDDRNVLDAYKYWNRQEMHNVALTENVKGNLGDKEKRFEYIITLTGLEPGNRYTVKKEELAGRAEPELYDATKGVVNSNAGVVNNVKTATIEADGDGNATFKVKLSDDQKINMIDLPVTSTYQVKEFASNHIPSYTITGTGPNPAVEGGKPHIAKDSDQTYVNSHTKEVDLPTETETVENVDGDVTIHYLNERDLETITGIPDMAIYFGIAGIVALLAFAAVRRKRDNGIAEL